MRTIIHKGVEIVKFNSTKIVVNTGGFFSQDFKAAINKASISHGLGFSISRENGEWVIKIKDDKLHLLSNKITLRR